jgi:hypothetical protein
MSPLLCYSYPFHIDKTSDPYLYSNNICPAFIFDNIRIPIRICFKDMKLDVGRALSDPHPIRFHPYVRSCVALSDDGTTLLHPSLLPLRHVGGADEHDLPLLGR